jgi:PD-(D/E)XK nuclease superfamily
MSQRADFNKTTFLERVSLAAKEPVYSAAFAWAIDDRSPLPLGQRLTIVAEVFGADTTGGRSISATTEKNKIDLLLSVKGDAGEVHVAIENKIKAAEGELQLAAYDQSLGQLSGEVKKVFLTLTGESPRYGIGWKPVSYSVLRDALCAQPASGSPSMDDLRDALTRLVAVADEARVNPRLAAVAFKDEEAGAANDVPSYDINSYVEEMRLKMVVQRIWMTELRARLSIVPPWKITIGESHGQALMDVEAALQEPPGYAVGVQLQRCTIKAFCKPHPYREKASEDQHQMVEIILPIIRSALSLSDDLKASRSRARGFRSYPVAILPRGRNLNQCIGTLEPLLKRLYSGLPSVTCLSPL